MSNVASVAAGDQLTGSLCPSATRSWGRAVGGPDTSRGWVVSRVPPPRDCGKGLSRRGLVTGEPDPPRVNCSQDEIDALKGDSLLSVLRQLRSGYDLRPQRFPQTIVLCGLRDVMDYRIHSGSTGEIIAGGSAFNISADSLRLGDFDRAEVEALLGQHTEERGQRLEHAAVDRIHTQAAGQPWLVNALCNEACFKNHQGRDRSRAITEDDILTAQEVPIQGEAVDLDQLANKLREERVQRVVEPMLSGAKHCSYTDRELEPVRDLGLVALDAPPCIANPIYAEVVPRELTAAVASSGSTV